MVEKTRDPIMPVPGAKQRDCLKFLADAILSDKAFEFKGTNGFMITVDIDSKTAPPAMTGM